MNLLGRITRGHVARRFFCACSLFSIAVIEGMVRTDQWPHARDVYWILIPFIVIGITDMLQKKQAIRRNFPIIGNFRYLFESIRPEINQYFVESNLDGRPFSRDQRSVIYQRAKGVEDTIPFGTQLNVYGEEYEWVNHSIAPKHPGKEIPRVLIGGPACKQHYSASVFNISAMSYGSLSKNAIRALNKGAKKGGFYHNTGEGGLTPYHLENGGDLVWQLGTAYFGARNPDGTFSPEKFKKKIDANPQVKMVEIKLSQGAKPGHGGILPAAKVTLEIAAIRDVAMGSDVISPPFHTAFDSPLGLMKFVQQLRDLSGGKPVGFKLCLGKHREFIAICKAMIETGIMPDFITVDGAEGGTGAAPLEFANSVGTPLNDGLVYVHNALVGCNLREHIKIIASGKVTTGMGIFSKFALGADLCNSARGMMFSVGCIQALRCNMNTCPTGVATQDPALVQGLVVEDKYERVYRYQKATVKSFQEVMGATGITHPKEIRPWHVQRRISPTLVKHYGEIYDFLEPGELLSGHDLPKAYCDAWDGAQTSSWARRKHS